MTFSTSAALTITTASISDGAGRISDAVDNSTDLYLRIHWRAQFQGGTTPTVDTVFEVYAFRQDDHAVQFTTDASSMGDAAVSRTPPNAKIIGTAVVTATSNEFATAEGVWEDPGPGNWAFVIMNETGATSDSTEADSFIHWNGEKA